MLADAVKSCYKRHGYNRHSAIGNIWKRFSWFSYIHHVNNITYKRHGHKRRSVTKGNCKDPRSKFFPIYRRDTTQTCSRNAADFISDVRSLRASYTISLNTCDELCTSDHWNCDLTYHKKEKKEKKMRTTLSRLHSSARVWAHHCLMAASHCVARNSEHCTYQL